MPHLTLEYSANLADAQRIGRLCKDLAQCLDAQRENGERVFPLGGIRVRALRCEQYCIADGRPDAAFLHANLKIAAGRSEAVRKASGDALFARIKQHFATEFEQHGLALSLEISEFSEAGTWKHNNLHARLKG
ncbi:5-carboxymethyl-2-hydroxymuconate Delta-isomerase [Paraburkholderia sp. Ac-20336]|uniref:5-carboxymethyl-2-hydroxymuconate Delta-isomerase n=1 Tax=unclassified Paraburkholderia TaxID=2615204 RepID=UPI00141DE45D|nr:MULTISPECIES: 5-carboxymethyl-2-hydroxymuconate Delta-isomerase [unclassified Paraburkholderia]MBN3806851.1 5-carboxymethyl-2-hydroxymuconate Delta-isomerase [Paraburkholderia sp. Ac-20336]MBN3849892.1 5-carboxymethyl-2-hydroxymuconate Delta-isomerase [Paraburkholderia sp. Ac-20342]NIF80813.1 5-carboxymethyl-2-hydroxymuconate Delta-isomerase [Paraburkholderia sp. Cy-641]